MTRLHHANVCIIFEDIGWAKEKGFRKMLLPLQSQNYFLQHTAQATALTHKTKDKGEQEQTNEAGSTGTRDMTCCLRLSDYKDWTKTFHYI